MNPVGPTDKYLCLQGKTFLVFLEPNILSCTPKSDRATIGGFWVPATLRKEKKLSQQKMGPTGQPNPTKTIYSKLNYLKLYGGEFFTSWGLKNFSLPHFFSFQSQD